MTKVPPRSASGPRNAESVDTLLDAAQHPQRLFIDESRALVTVRDAAHPTARREPHGRFVQTWSEEIG